MGVELFLDEKMFDALDMLASRVGDYFTTKELCEAVYGESESPGIKEIAHEVADNLLRLIGAVGHGFMWIEHLPEAGYVFKTHWGNNWKTQSIPVMTAPADEPTADELTAAMHKLKKRRNRHSPPFAAIISVAVAVAAVVVLALLFLLNTPILQPSEVVPAYAEFDEPHIPLTSFEVEEDN